MMQVLHARPESACVYAAAGGPKIPDIMNDLIDSPPRKKTSVNRTWMGMRSRLAWTMEELTHTLTTIR